ncbi:hypothetical protein HYH03_014616 [Edaphochlamys debaryana]|uniref:EF-hand domain-containing protein n=1 Tax=Edaphochlamys debaryana TaxID=47281 RepID=A0A836BS17_9CHLO|nr:hypothetical protein HYH03_014616 [Edaphochlamys debaryana]|eukprot:KAG2486687.1 hypothetical protein HYH03_014616 [Edaphochlamys debaryana]
MGAGCSSEKAAATTQEPVVASKAAPGSKGDADKAAAPEMVKPAPGSAPVAAKAEPEPALKSQDDLGDEDDVGDDVSKRDPEARREALTRCFQALDKDKSGTIDFKELKQYLFRTGVNIDQITGRAEELMRKMDLNEDNLISEEEFTHMMDALLSAKSDEDLEVWVAEVVFTATSRNVVGFGDSLGEVLAELNLSGEQVDTLKRCFKALDKDLSGFVELDDLKVALKASGLDFDKLSEEVHVLMAKLDKVAV